MSDIAGETPEFDEAWYLEKYSDIRNAVANGKWTSGLSHYMKHGKGEGRLGCAPVEATPVPTDLLPITEPPAPASQKKSYRKSRR